MMSITKLIGEVVKEASTRLFQDSDKINYIFGNAQYIKEQLDIYSKGTEDKFPLVALFTPIREQRGLPDVQCRTSLNLLIACSTAKEYTNEERETESFEKILRPIYLAIMDEIERDVRFHIEYNGEIKHDYSENYSYGRYGAYTESGEEVSEPIDAINISSMELSINKPSCR